MVCRFQGQWGLCEFLPLGWPKLYFKATWKKVRLPNSIKSWHSGVQKRQIPFSDTRRRRCTTSEIHEKLKQRLDTVPSGTCVYDHSPSGAYRMQNSWWHTTLNVSFTQYSVRPPHISACQRFWLAEGLDAVPVPSEQPKMLGFDDDGHRPCAWGLRVQIALYKAVISYLPEQ